MTVPTTPVTRPTPDFLARMHGKRIVIETRAMQPTLQPERYAGILEEAYDDSLLIRPDNGRLVLVYKHAILSVTEAEAPEVEVVG
ncbi:MAG: hypothetical protein ACXVCO_06560 [Ktedonobacterales bacterium]